MDLAEKRKQLEALRAARQAKQHVVEQYMSSRSANASVALNTSDASLASVTAPSKPPAPESPRAAAADATRQPLPPPASQSPGSSRPASPSAAAGTGRRTASPTATRRVAVAQQPASPSSAQAAGPLPPPQPARAKVMSPRALSAATAPASPPAAATASVVARPPTPKAAAASPSPRVAPGDSPVPAATPIIQVLSLRHADPAASGGEPASSTGGGGAPQKPPSRPASPSAGAAAAAAAAAAGTAARASAVRRSGGERRPSASATSASVAKEQPAASARSGWDLLSPYARSATGTAGLRGWAGEAAAMATTPTCVFNPAVVLGDGAAASSSSSNCRRVILDAVAALVPYEGGAADAAGRPHGGATDGTRWSVGVAAAYGAQGRDGADGTAAGAGGAVSGLGSGQRGAYHGGSAGDYPLHGARRRGSAESAAAVAGDAHSGRGVAAAAAAAALAGVRATMTCGYAWGSASAAAAPSPSTHATTMEAAMKVAREAPGLVLAWFVVPLPPSASAAAAAATASPPAESAATAPAGARPAAMPEYVVVVLPLVCDSEVTTLLAHPFAPSTLLGGTRCGRVVQWAMAQAWAHVEPRRLVDRALATTGTATTLLLPPQRPAHSSFPSPQAHQAPVLRLAIHGDASCHHLYSVSQEGRVCTWPAWQPSHPTASCSSYLGIRPMGHIGTAARFVERAGTDAMTQVFIGTSSGALLVGVNRDARAIELQYCGPQRPLPTSTTVVKTLDVTACLPAPVAPDASAAGATGGAGDSTTRRTQQQQQPSSSSSSSAFTAHPYPHRGRVVSMALQTATHGFRGQDCVVTAATDGTCAAWFDRTAVPLDGFTSAVTSVCWSPTRPGVLAAGDASGLVTLWSVAASLAAPVGTVALAEAGRRTRGSVASDAVLWVVAGASDAAAGWGGALEDEGDDADVANYGDGGALLPGGGDGVGLAVSSVLFSRDGRWLFACTASGHVYALRVSDSLV